jgi:hypothetical protein
MSVLTNKFDKQSSRVHYETSKDYSYEVYDGALLAKATRLSNSNSSIKVAPDFSRAIGRDNSIYRINEGNNLDQ